MLITETMILSALLLILYGGVDGVSITNQHQPCRAKGLARYNLTFYTHWSPEEFPKQYPVYRPPAQWSKLIGRSHNQYYQMWEYEQLSSEAFKLFVEKSDSSLLDDEVQGHRGIFDVFNVPAIDSGVGVASTKIFVDEYHPKVTAVSRIIPSPDWFVGVDSVDLCDGYRWKDTVSIDLDPYDAGTDQGFTFTAPNWAEPKPKGIAKITNLVPNHPANSFYYPDLERLPRIAHVVFTKVNTYSFRDGTVDMDIPPPGGYVDDTQADSPASGGASHETEGLSVAPDGEPRFVPRGNPPESSSFTIPKPKSSKPTRKPFSIIYGDPGRGPQNSPKIVRGPPTRPPVVLRPPGRKPTSSGRKPTSSEKRAKQQGRRQNRRRGGNRRRQKNSREKPTRGPKVDCAVSEFTEWSACSKTCGFGTKRRTRRILVRNQNYGRPCPALVEEEVCGSMRTCNWNHFNTNNWDRNKSNTSPRRTSLFSGFNFKKTG